VSALGGIGLAALEPLCKRRHQALHGVGVVLAHQLEVDAVLAHQAAQGGLLAAGGEHHAHLRIPRPVIEAHLGQVGAAGRRRDGVQ